MITVILIKNPFEPDKGRETYQTPYIAGKTAIDYVEMFAKGYFQGFFVRDASKLVDFDHVPADGSMLVVTPVVGKGSFLGMILSIGLSIVAFGVGGLVSTGAWGGLAAATGWSAVAGYLTAAAVMMIGGSLIQRSFGTANIGAKDARVDPTYSWDGQTTTTGQGAYIPITYGTVMTGGQIISEYVDTQDNKQYLYRLYAAGEGPLEIHDVLINDNPASQYENIYIDTRPGDNDQAVIDGFNKSVSQKGLGYELSDSVWRSEIVTGTATEGIMLSLEASNGLYHQNDSGNLETASVTIAAQYRKRGSDTWLNFAKKRSITGNTTGVSVELSSQDVAPGTYTVTSKRLYGTYVRRGVTYEDKSDYRGIQVIIGSYESSRMKVTGRPSYRVLKEVLSNLQCGPFKVKVAGHTKENSPLISGTITVTETGDVIRMSGKSTTAIRRAFYMEHIDPGEYEVQLKITGYSHDKGSVRNSLRIYWTAVSGIVYEDFIYPGIGLLSMKGMATDQLSGSPTVKFLKTRKTIWAWNPHKLEYEEKAADNPAWAAYDYIHQAYKIKDVNTGEWVMDVRGAPKELMLYDRFERWAAFCDDRGLKINIELTQPENILTTINKDIAPVGYGCVLLYGTKYGPVWDAPSMPVQLFGMGNIVKGTYQEEFLATNDRANAIEVTFTNAQKNYERDTVTVYGKSYDTETGKTTQVTMNGITNYDQAYRYGMFQLACNERLVRTVSFEADIDAIACTVGDVVYVSHDIPSWAVSGRVAAIDGNKVTLYALFESYDSTKNYQITYRSQTDDSLYAAKCDITVTDHTVIATLTEEPEVMPQLGDVCAVASVSTGCKPFTIKSITRSNTGNSMRRKLTCLEYDAAIFGEDYDVPEINYSDQVMTVDGPDNLQVKASLYLSGNDSGKYMLTCTWTNPKKPVTVHFLVSEDQGATFKEITTLSHGETQYSFDGEEGKNYIIRLYGTNEIGMESDYVQATANVSGLIAPAPTPEDVTAYTRYRQLADGSHVYDIAVAWKGGMTGGVYYKSNHGQAIDIVFKEDVPADELGYESAWTFAGYGKGQIIISGAIPGDTYKIAVTTANVLGIYTLPDESPQATVRVALKTTVPNTPDGLAVSFTDVVTASWEAVTNTDIACYELRLNQNFGADDGLLARTNSLSAIVPITKRIGTVYLAAVGTDGKYSAPATLTYEKPLPPTPKEPELNAKLGGFSVVEEAIPAGCNGMTVYIDGAETQTVHTVNNTLTFTCNAGIYNVTCAYTDLLGEGERSPTSRVTVKVIVDNDLIKQGAISMDKVEATLQETIKTGGGANNKIVQLVKDLNDPEDYKKYTAFVQLDDAIELRVKSDEVVSKINMSKEGTTIDGKLLHVTGDTVIDNNLITKGMIQAGAVSADKLDVKELSAITATIGLLRTATSGARTEIRDNLIEVYDENGVLRVRMGVW